MRVTGEIFDIQHYSISDGPGIRTTVFFKGCPLRCLWCGNPESQSSRRQLLYMEALCGRCGRCVEICDKGATAYNENGSVKVDRSICDGCGRCVGVCPSEARMSSGKAMTVDEVVEIVKKDALFYRNSTGGVTASGGEPTQQPAFLKELFMRCQDIGIHTALETCGYVRWEVLHDILKYVDLVLFDIKHMDSDQHKYLTGVGNETILDNVRRLSKMKQNVVIRFPLIPGCNDSDGNVVRTGEFMRELRLSEIELLPYHRLGTMKYEKLGRVYTLRDLAVYEEERLMAIKDMLIDCKLDVRIL